MSEDRTLTCQDCSQQFVFTTRDQAFFAERNFSEPKRCRTCAKQRRQSLRQDYQTVCAACGKETTVPFQPKLDAVTGQPVKPVYCRDCFDARNQNAAAGQPQTEGQPEAQPEAQQPVADAAEDVAA